jgi:hypothetical protein
MGMEQRRRTNEMTTRKDITKLDLAIQAVKDNDRKIVRAIGQNKMIMAAYYYGRVIEIFQLYGKAIELKKNAPGVQLIRDFSKSVKKSPLYESDKRVYKELDLDNWEVS